MVANELFSVSVLSGIDWYDEGPDDFHSMECDELIVRATGWFFAASPRHATYAVDTTYLNFAQMGSLIDAATAAGKTYAVWGAKRPI